MKKRSSPVVLASALGLLLLVAFTFSALNARLITLPGPRAQTPAQAKDDGHDHGPQETKENKEEKDKIASNVAGQIASTKPRPTPVATEAGDNPRGEKPGMPPSILMDKQAASTAQPKPNDSSTSTQWYNQNSMNANR